MQQHVINFMLLLLLFSFLTHWDHYRAILREEDHRNLIHTLLLETQKVNSEAEGYQPKFTFDLIPGVDPHLETRPLLLFF